MSATTRGNSAMRIQGMVLWAILLREVRTRFGRNRLGYLWALLGPLANVVILMLIFEVLGRLAPRGLDFALFLSTGIVPWFMFQNTVNRAMKAIEGNRGLLVYPRVKPLDLVIARSLLEVATYAVIFVMLLALLAARGSEAVVPDRPLEAVAVFLAVALLSAGLGALAAAFQSILASTEQIVQLSIRPFYFLSGIFFSAEIVPEPYRSWLLYNPLLQANELMRAAFFRSYDGRYADPEYLLAWVVGAVFLGLVGQRAFRRFVTVTA